MNIGTLQIDPPLLYPDYVTSRLRAPSRTFGIIPRGMTELTGPVFGASRYGIGWDARLLDERGRVRAEMKGLRVRKQSPARIPLLAGCSSNSLIAGDREVEDSPGLALGLYHLPGADLHVFHFTQKQVEEFNGAGYWPGRWPGRRP